MSNLVMLFSLIYTLLLIGILVVLFLKDMMSRRVGLFLLVVSLVFTGFIFSGVPDPVAQMMGLMEGAFSGNIDLFPLVGIGILLLTVVLAGRLFCGFVCPLGVVQELVSKAGLKQIEISGKTSQRLRIVFFLLLLMVVILFIPYGRLNPLEVFTLHPSMIQSSIFAVIVGAGLFIYRPWCTLLCPFGILANLAARLSVFRLRIDEQECIECGECTAACPTSQPMEVDNLPECYSCQRCVEVCPTEAIETRR